MERLAQRVVQSAAYGSEMSAGSLAHGVEEIAATQSLEINHQASCASQLETGPMHADALLSGHS